VDEYGNYYGDSAPPELIAMVPSLEDAVRAYGPQTRKSPPSVGSEGSTGDSAD
jgi:hypothetical protein